MIMINLTLYRKEMKSNFMLFVIFAGVILLYGSIVSSIFTPDVEAAGWLDSFVEMYPGMMGFIGFNVENLTNYQAFISGYLYGMLFIMFGIIYTILLSNKLIFRYLNDGSFTYLLSTPDSRSKLLFTQMKVLGSYLFLMVLLMFLVVAGFGSISHFEHVDWGVIAYLNFSFLIMLLFISSITMFASSLFEGKIAFGLNIGVPIILFFFKMISNLGSNYEWFKYLTPFSLFDTMLIIKYDVMAIVNNLILLLFTIIILVVTFKLFNKKDLSI